MRFINLNGRTPKQAWLRKAQRVLQKLNTAADDAARKTIIGANEGVWKELLPWLRRITKGKCWFSESRGACQYWEVEHFRPKGAAKNLDGTERPEGYWWLAFEWENFRLCGGVSNRKKGFYFPLRTGTHIATSANRNIDDESPYLLDPTKQEDPLLLTFNRNGDVNATPNSTTWDTERATVSIKRYKLQEHEEFVEARRDTWARCELEINRCRNLLQDESTNPSATNRQKIRAQMQKLREMVSQNSQRSQTIVSGRVKNHLSRNLQVQYNSMPTTASALVQKVWNYAHVLKDDGLAFMDYTEQITYLLFLKMASERQLDEATEIPSLYTWETLKKISDHRVLLDRYHQGLRTLSERPGLLGLIFTKPQSKINDPSKLHYLIKIIDSENWSALDVDVKGEVYEGLLAKNADDVRGGAGQYFTPRPIIRAIVEVMRPEPLMRISDPACGTGGFLLAAFDYLKSRTANAKSVAHLHTKALQGIDLVPNVARLCAMNLFLHGIGLDPKHPVISISDSLESKQTAQPVDMVLTNPPFGKKSSFTIIGKGGRNQTDKISYQRPDFWATTSNKQLNFVQHVYSMLKESGRAAVVVPDNVLFEGGAGEKIRRTLLQRCDVHTLLRLPTGIWYSPGVKANVIFFDKQPQTQVPATKEIWVYDLRSEKHFSLRQHPIRPEDLTDFIHCYSTGDRSKRQETGHFRRFKYTEIIARDKASLDFQWKQELEKSSNGSTPQALMREILADLDEAMKEFAAAEEEIQQ